ncbi:hypothetical protein [Streptomyces sp. NPDC002845]
MFAELPMALMLWIAPAWRQASANPRLAYRTPWAVCGTVSAGSTDVRLGRTARARGRPCGGLSADLPILPTAAGPTVTNAAGLAAVLWPTRRRPRWFTVPLRTAVPAVFSRAGARMRSV